MENEKFINAAAFEIRQDKVFHKKRQTQDIE